MKDSYNLIYVGIASMILAFVIALLKIRIIQRAYKVVVILLGITILNEFVGDIVARQYHSNIIVYSIYNPIQLFIISCYFNYTIGEFKKRHLGLLIGGAIGFAGLLYGLFVQKANEFNGLFLLTESIIIVGMCLYAFYELLLADDDLNLTTYSHFWITCIFLFFWLSTFLFWGLYDFMIGKLGINPSLIHVILLIINVVTYLGFAVVFLFYDKMQKSHEQ